MADITLLLLLEVMNIYKSAGHTVGVVKYIQTEKKQSFLYCCLSYRTNIVNKHYVKYRLR